LLLSSSGVTGEGGWSGTNLFPDGFNSSLFSGPAAG
jgi:hypothetical protein